MKLSLIVPSFRVQDGLNEFLNLIQIKYINCNYNYEMIFIDDSNKHNIYNKLKLLYQQYKQKVSIVKFPYNFNKNICVYTIA